MQYEIKHIHDRLGVTVVYVTHDQTEALTMSDRVAVFNDGIVQQLSTPNELYENPQNAFVAQFIGEHNTLSGTVKQINGSKCTVKTDGGETVIAEKINVHEVGERTTLSLRPERVELDLVDGMDDVLTGKVEERIYLGDHIRVRVNVAGNDQFIVKVRNRSDMRTLNVGQTVKVGSCLEFK